MSTEAKYYGVSTGNGNDGVSQLHPDYIVLTDDPFTLADKAARAHFKSDKATQSWLDNNLEIDGEAEYTISAVVRETIETQEEREKLSDALETLSEIIGSIEYRKIESRIEDYGSDTSYFILEVFPIPAEEHEHMGDRTMVYDSIEDAGL